MIHGDIYGSRASKNAQLSAGMFSDAGIIELNPEEPYFFFSRKDFSNLEEYDRGLSLTDVFVDSGSGVKTERDRVSIHFDKASIADAIADFSNGDEDELRKKYGGGGGL